MIWILIYAVVIASAVGLANPAVSFTLLIFSFGLFYLPMLLVGLVALFGPVLLVVGAFLRRNLVLPANIWALAMIEHIGWSIGQSRWGDVGSTMGGKNMPLFESFMSPILFFVNRF